LFHPYRDFQQLWPCDMSAATMPPPAESPWLERPLMLSDLVAELDQEISMRVAFYPKLVTSKKISQAVSDHRIMVLQHLLVMIKAIDGAGSVTTTE
jgi:hypothetical protein